MKSFTSIEPLEDRIAPAAVFTFVDVDGDMVKVSSSKGTHADLATATQVSAGQLTTLDLSHATWGNEFAGDNLTIKVFTRGAAGDGVVNVGYINATGINLGAVTVGGDLGKIVAGTSSATIPAVQSLAVHSLGSFGTATGAPDNIDTISGSIGAFAVSGDVQGANVTLSGKAGSMKIGGSLMGNSAGNGGMIHIAGYSGPISIGGSVIGGTSENSGYFTTDSSVASIKIGGSVIGGIQDISGAVSVSGAAASISVGGSIVGGNGFFTGLVVAGKNVGSFTVGGSIAGGQNTQTGEVGTLGSIGFLSIGGSVTGGSGLDSGYIYADGTLGSVRIGENLIGGTGQFSGQLNAANLVALRIGGNLIGGSLTNAGGIDCQQKIGTISIGGDISGLSSAVPVPIIVGGSATPKNAAQALALRSLTVGGSVSDANIIVGDFGFQQVQVGSVHVMGDWTASNLVVGAHNLGTDNMPGGTGINADNVNFGDFHDFLNSAGAGPIPGKIASIIIGGQINGTSGGSDHFGFVARYIVSVNAGGHAVPLEPGPGDDIVNIGETGDVTIHEL